MLYAYPQLPSDDYERQEYSSLVFITEQWVQVLFGRPLFGMAAQ
jgi:hypothetical protein